MVDERMPVDPENPEEEVIVEEPDTWFDEQIKKTPYWSVSLGVHGLILFVCWMVVMATGEDKKEIIVAVPLQQKPEDEFDETKERDVFKNNKPVDDADGPPIEDPVIVKDWEQSDHNESADNEDFKQMKGDSFDFMSRQPFKGYGALDTIGIGGGAGGSYGGRFGGKRNLVRRGGGGRATESAVEAALRWLKRHQDEDGRWDADGFSKHCGADMCQTPGMKSVDSGLTGLAVLAYLGAGHTQKGGRYKDTVRRGLDWLCTIQKADGDLRFEHDMYCHAMASMALIEAYGMTQDYKYKQAAQKAVDFIVEAQNPGAGWRYRPKGGDNDISVTGWQLMALKSAKMSGLTIPGGVFDGARKFVDSTASGAYRGKFSYQSPEGTSPRRTAIGMVCLLFMGDPPGDGRFDESATHVNSELPNWTSPDFYKWYYAALAINLVGGNHWKVFNEAMKSTLCPNQRRGGHADGSWDSENDPYAREGRGGRVLATAVGALCLEVYYRYSLMQK